MSARRAWPSYPPKEAYWFCLFCWKRTEPGKMFCSRYCDDKDNEGREPL